MKAVADPNSLPEMFRSPGAELNEGAEIAPWLLRAAIARYVLAGFLYDRRGTGSLLDYMFNVVDPAVRKRHGVLVAFNVRQANRQLASGDIEADSPNFRELQYAFATLTDINASRFPATLDEIAWADPIARLFNPTVSKRGTQADCETTFVSHALAYFDSKTSKVDSDFARLFWQVVRV